jgi:hypothetical protein
VVSRFESCSATKFMADEAWKTTFEVKHRTEYRDDGDNGSTYLHFYDIINLHSGHVVGTYLDGPYAVKQARRKYKKLVRLMEKHFTS